MERLNNSNNRNLYSRDLLLSILRNVEDQLDEDVDIPSLQNSAIVTATETHGMEVEHVEQHSVSSVTVRLVSPKYSLHSEDTISIEYEWEFENLSENIDISQIEDERFHQNIHSVRFNWNGSENYPITELADNIIFVRMIWDFRDRENGNQTARMQFIWSSNFSWLEIMRHLEHNTYHFEFNYHAMAMHNNDRHSTDDFTEHDPVQRRLALDGLSTVTITHQQQVDSGGSLICPICHDPFTIGDCAKQLPCGHLYHPWCILEWFMRRLSCPVCRDEPIAPMLLNLGH